MLTALATAAFVAGVAGAWSPCGFSIVETLAPGGFAGRRRTTALACATFALGALAGGVATFGALALLGRELGAGGGAAAAVATALLLAAAAGDAAGRRIVPQVRRQVPEPWRRVLPVPLAAGLYGVLLGLGFTTFVLSFALYALAAASLALGDPKAGVVLGLAFAAGRALPVIALAPAQETERGALLAAAMAERPGALRAIRALGAVALAVAAGALALAGSPATAASKSVAVPDGTDPSASGSALAWQAPGHGGGAMRRPGEAAVALPGSDPAVGGGLVVWREGESLVVAPQAALQVRLRIPAPGVEEPAVSARWLVWRAREPGGDALRGLDLRSPGSPPVALRSTRAPDRIGRPSLDGDRVVYHLARRTSSRIEEIHLPTLRRTALRRAPRGTQLLNPSAHGGLLLLVSASAERQQLLLGPRRLRRGGRDRRLLSMHPTVRRDAAHEPGRGRHRAGYPGGRPRRLPQRAPAGVQITLWSTALAPDAAYVSRMRRTRAGTATAILRIER